MGSQNYRKGWGNARMHLKLIGSGVGGIESVIDGFSKKGNRLTDGLTDGQTILWRSKDASKICIFNALIHDKKLIIKLWAISYHRFMKKVHFVMNFLKS